MHNIKDKLFDTAGDLPLYVKQKKKNIKQLCKSCIIEEEQILNMLTLQEMHIHTSVCTPMSIVTCPSCASALRNRRKAESLVCSTLQCIEFHIEGCLCSLAFNAILLSSRAEKRPTQIYGRHFQQNTKTFSLVQNCSTSIM